MTVYPTSLSFVDLRLPCPQLTTTMGLRGIPNSVSKGVNDLHSEGLPSVESGKSP